MNIRTFQFSLVENVIEFSQQFVTEFFVSKFFFRNLMTFRDDLRESQIVRTKSNILILYRFYCSKNKPFFRVSVFRLFFVLKVFVLILSKNNRFKSTMCPPYGIYYS